MNYTEASKAWAENLSQRIFRSGGYTQPDESKMTNRKIPLQYTEEVIDAEFEEIVEPTALIKVEF